MKKLPRILMFFCTAFAWSTSPHAAELFDFDDYEARMESSNTADQEAEREINNLYAPLENYDLENYDDQLRQALTLSLLSQPKPEKVVPLNPPDHEGDSIMQKILAESIRTANLEQTQREIDTAKGEAIRLNNKVGELTGIVEERLTKKEGAWKVLMSLSGPNPQIEALEDHEEKERKLKVREEERIRARDTWVNLHMLHATAEAELKETETREDSINEQYRALSEKLESLQKEGNDLGGLLEIVDK